MDDDPATNRIHALVLGEQPDMEVVGATTRPDEVLAAVERHRPDVVLLDYVLGGIRCEEVVREIASVHPSVRIVILSGFEPGELKRELRGLQVAGVLTKGPDLGEFLESVRRAIHESAS